MSDISNQLIKNSYDYVLQSDLVTGIVYRIGGAVPVNPIFSSGLTINSGFTYSNGTEQNGYTLICDAFGNANWGPISGIPTGSLTYYVSASTPTGVSLISGDRWFDTSTGDELVWINDGDSAQWIQICCGGGGGTDTYVTGLTINGNEIVLTQNRTDVYSSFTINLSGDYLPLSGGTVTGDTIFQSGLTANTISALTYSNVPVVTGGTYTSGTITFNNATGGTFNVTGLPVGGQGGQLYYFNTSVTQTPYKEFGPTGTTASEQSTTISVASGITSTIESYLTPSGYPNSLILPGGVWSFYLHSYKEDSSSSFDLYCDVYKRTSGGTETYLFSTDPFDVTSTASTPSMGITDAYFSGTPLTVSDRILVLVRATNTGVSTKNITFVSEGLSHYSYGITTFNGIPANVSSLTTGVGLSGDSTTGAVTLVNTAPDQTVTITSPNNIEITGLYPNFGINFTGGTVTGNTVFSGQLTANTVNIYSTNAPPTPTVSTPFIDDYNRATLSPGGTPSLTYTNTNTGAGNSTIVTNYLNINNGNPAGQSYTTIPLSGFSSPFNTTLSSNNPLSTIEWTFNLRTNRASIFSGFLAGNYGGAVVLAGSNTNLQSLGSGYALIYGTTASRNWKLVKYNNGLAGTQTDVIAGGTFSSNTSYVSARIVYAPLTNTWTYYFRDDGTVAWGDPTTVTTLIGSAVDSTYTSIPMSVFGVFFNYSTAASQNLQFDNLRVQQTITPTSTPTDELIVKSYSGNDVFKVKDDGSTTTSGSVTSNSGFFGSFSGTHLGNGSSLILGQSGVMLTGSTSLTVSSATTALTLVPGLTTTITVSAQTMVYIQTNGGVNTISTSVSGGSALDFAIVVDGAILTAGGYQRMYADNPTANATVTNWVANWNMAVVLTLSAGTHTVQVQTVYVAGANATVSGGATTIKQGTLSIMVLKNI